MVSLMLGDPNDDNDDIKIPSYGFNNGNRALSFCLNGLVGNKIEVLSYSKDGTDYQGVVRFTFYDHFGLDTPDLAVPKLNLMYTSAIPAFRQWYILQHFEDLICDVLPKPFVTLIQFDVHFSGVII